MVTAKVIHLAAEFGLHQVILHKLKYPLVATAVTLCLCNDIMSNHNGRPTSSRLCKIFFPWYSPWTLDMGWSKHSKSLTKQVIAQIHTY